ncbi:hypothetical protein B566_EDAN009922 [Ephemera danica]|nr:hypothetical protein B566_EDAN009922 [Ephemera danica]
MSLLGRPNRFRGLFRRPFSMRGKATSVSTTALNQSHPTSLHCPKNLSTAAVSVDPLQVCDYASYEESTSSSCDDESLHEGDFLVETHVDESCATANNINNVARAVLVSLELINTNE